MTTSVRPSSRSRAAAYGIGQACPNGSRGPRKDRIGLIGGLERRVSHKSDFPIPVAISEVTSGREALRGGTAVEDPDDGRYPRLRSFFDIEEKVSVRDWCNDVYWRAVGVRGQKQVGARIETIKTTDDGISNTMAGMGGLMSP